MDPNTPRDLHGRALWDYFAGDEGATLGVHGDLGEYDEIPVSLFFRGPDAFLPFERVAMAECRGRVLDVGAGTGVHALALQDRGFEVTAVEVMPQAAEIMRRRGVSDVVELDLILDDGWDRRIRPGIYDTVLMMMNGTGITGSLEGLGRFLRRAKRIAKPDGQILVDSGDLRSADERDGPPGHPKRADGRYFGEAQIQLEYRGTRGQPFAELYVDPDTLAAVADREGWRSTVVFEDGASYLARLTRSS